MAFISKTLSKSIIELKKLGGVKQTLKLLDSSTPMVAENAALVIANSSHESDEVCIELINVGGLKCIVSHMDDKNISIRDNSIRIISNTTCVDPELLVSIDLTADLRKLGALKILMKLLYNKDDKLRKYCTTALGNLTCEDVKLRRELCHQDAIPALISMIHDKNLRENAISVLANITFDNARGVKLISDNDGIVILMQCLVDEEAQVNIHLQSESFVEGVLNILCNCIKECVDLCPLVLERKIIKILTAALDSKNELLQEYAIQSLHILCGTYLGEDYLKQVRSEVVSCGLIAPLVLLLVHDNEMIRDSCVSCLMQLRGGEGETLVPFLETGCAPILFLYKFQKKYPEVITLSNELIAWLQSELRGPVLALLIRSLTSFSVAGNEKMMAAIGLSVFYLAYGAPHIQSAFLYDGGLNSLFNLLQHSDSAVVDMGIHYLVSIEPLVEHVLKVNTGALYPVIDALLLDESHFNIKETSNFKFYIGGDETVFYAHKEILIGNRWLRSSGDLKQLSIPDEDVGYQEFVACMRYIYFGMTVSLLEEGLLDVQDKIQWSCNLMRVAAKYELYPLRNACGVYLNGLLRTHKGSSSSTSSSSIDNNIESNMELILQLMQPALQSNDLNLSASILNYISKDIRKLIQSESSTEIIDFLRKFIKKLLEESFV